MSSEYQTTIGVDFRVKILEIDGKRVKLHIFDLGGQDKFRTIISSYYRDTSGVLLMYDVTNRNTFQHINYWNEEVDRYLCNGARLLVGNKADPETNREVTAKEGIDLAQSFGMDFIETSAKTALNVEEAFLKLTKATLATIPVTDSLRKEAVTISRSPEEQKNWCF